MRIIMVRGGACSGERLYVFVSADGKSQLAPADDNIRDDDDTTADPDGHGGPVVPDEPAKGRRPDDSAVIEHGDDIRWSVLVGGRQSHLHDDAAKADTNDEGYLVPARQREYEWQG